MNVRQESRELLSLMQLVSSNCPMGGFVYSRGLELAVEYGWINSVESFINWQKQWIYGSLIYLEWPMLKRCYYYVQVNDAVRFLECALKILSYRDTYELRAEERQRGQAITELILQWYLPINKDWLLALRCSGLASIAWLGCMWGISLEKLALGYAYNTLEASVMIGLKLIPFGQKTAQKLLRYLVEFLPYAWEKSDLVKDEELGSNFLLQSIASACHETQYSRLFRS